MRLFCLILAAIATSFLAAKAVPATAAEAKDPAPAIYDLVKLWRLDPDDDDLVFGIIAGAVFDADGRCYLLGGQLAQIYVIDDHGDLVATLGRPGEGPGEFRNPSGLAWWDEQTLAVAQRGPGRLELIDVRGGFFASQGSLILAHRRIDPAGRVVREWETFADCRDVYVCYRATRRN